MKQALIGIGSGLVAGSLALALMFLGPLSQSSQESEPIASQTAVPEATISASPVESEPEPTVPEIVQCSVSGLLILQPARSYSTAEAVRPLDPHRL